MPYLGRPLPRQASQPGLGGAPITADLSAGPHSAVILTTDLTEAYVHENSAYAS